MNEFQSRQSASQFSHSVMSDYFQYHGLQHARLPCPSQFPELAQTHVHPVGDTIQPSHPLSSPAQSTVTSEGMHSEFPFDHEIW